MAPILGAIVDIAGANGLGSLSTAAICAVIRKRSSSAAATLEEAMRAGNLSLREDPSLEEWVPSAYRFFESARIGSSTAKLRILARLMVDSTNRKELNSNEFSVVCSKLERIDDESLEILSILKVAIDEKLFENNINYPDRVTINSKIIARRFSIDEIKILNGLTELANAGLIILIINVTVDGGSDSYLDTKWLHAIFRHALEA